jgi:hypothetical protein
MLEHQYNAKLPIKLTANATTVKMKDKNICFDSSSIPNTALSIDLWMIIQREKKESLQRKLKTSIRAFMYNTLQGLSMLILDHKLEQKYP